ncbi:MAG TPA: AAA family ATPase [Thermoplasmata archaeon]|nr:AAA family ATPase [Thermoplasmata archaeon]
MVATAASDHRPLTERIRPAKLSEIIGNRRAVADLRRWASSWDSETGVPPTRRAALLEGPPGVGKTTAAVALAREHGWSLVEMNASDARNQEAIGDVAGRAALTNTLGEGGTYLGTRKGGRTLILLDEADCLTGRAREEAASRPAPVNLRDFLRGRYRSVDALASAWGLGRPGNPPAFEAWDSVPTTGGRGAWTKLKEAQRDLVDWRSTARSHDSSDRGGLGAIARLVRETRQPLLLTVNDPSTLTRYSQVFRTNVVRIRFEPVAPTEMLPWLARAATAQGYRIPPALLERIVQRSRGDVRAAVTDLEAISVLPDAANAETLFGSRDLEADYADFTSEVLAQPRFYRSVEIQDRLNATPDDLLPWIEENLPRAAGEPSSRHEGYRVLAQAEQFLAWARRERVYSLWSYASETMTGGVSVALAEGGHGRVPYISFPEFLGAMGRSRAQRAARLALLAKLGPRVHLSRRKGVDGFLPFLERLFVSSGKASESVVAARRAVARELKLSPEDLAYLIRTEPDGAKVREILGAATEPEAATPEPPEAGSEPDRRTAGGAPAARRKVQRRLGEF